LRRFVAFPYKLVNVADVIIMHSVEKSLIYVQLSTLAWAACDLGMIMRSPRVHLSNFLGYFLRVLCPTYISNLLTLLVTV